MTDEQVGAYIRLLCAQHQHGGRIDTNVLRTYCSRITNGDAVMAKFQHDERGSYNERLNEEMEKRREKSVKATESVRKRWDKRNTNVSKSNNERNTNVIRSENVNEEDRSIVSDEVSYEIISTNSNLNSEEKSKRARPSRRQLFRNSPYANFEDFASKIYRPEYEDVDLEHYHRAIMAWSDIKDARELRTPEGWIQTAHLWIRKDSEKGSLVKKSAQKVHTVFGAMDQRTIDYLNL